MTHGSTRFRSDLASAAILSASGAHWEEHNFNDYWNWNTDTRTTAIVLNALIQLDPQNSITANAVRWLMAHRESGHWHSTQETAWSLMALTNWLTASKEYDSNYQFAVGLNGAALKQGQATKDNLTETVKLQVENEGSAQGCGQLPGVHARRRDRQPVLRCLPAHDPAGGIHLSRSTRA